MPAPRFNLRLGPATDISKSNIVHNNFCIILLTPVLDIGSTEPLVEARHEMLKLQDLECLLLGSGAPWNDDAGLRAAAPPVLSNRRRDMRVVRTPFSTTITSPSFGPQRFNKRVRAMRSHVGAFGRCGAPHHAPDRALPRLSTRRLPPGECRRNHPAYPIRRLMPQPSARPGWDHEAKVEPRPGLEFDPDFSTMQLDDAP